MFSFPKIKKSATTSVTSLNRVKKLAVAALAAVTIAIPSLSSASVKSSLIDLQSQQQDDPIILLQMPSPTGMTLAYHYSHSSHASHSSHYSSRY
jgi:hypothetical protein